MDERCALCGHQREGHNGYGADNYCTWAQNPLSPTGSLFCKCMSYQPSKEA